MTIRWALSITMFDCHRVLVQGRPWICFSELLKWAGIQDTVYYIKIKLSYVNRGLGLVVNFQGIHCILEIWGEPTSHVVIGVTVR